jgi:hypothetical protein
MLIAAQLQLELDSAARREDLDRRIARLLRSGQLDRPEQELLSILAQHKGAANAISIRQLLSQLTHWSECSSKWSDWTERDIKAAVKDLIERFGIPIGGSRSKPYGYFLVMTIDDQLEAGRPLLHEIRSLARRHRILTSRQETARLLRQIELDLDADTETRNSKSETRGAA